MEKELKGGGRFTGFNKGNFISWSRKFIGKFENLMKKFFEACLGGLMFINDVSNDKLNKKRKVKSFLSYLAIFERSKYQPRVFKNQNMSTVFFSKGNLKGFLYFSNASLSKYK